MEIMTFNIELCDTATSRLEGGGGGSGVGAEVGVEVGAEVVIL